jgi:hypothetical protein
MPAANVPTPPPEPSDGRDPAELITAAVDEVLRLASTWLAWDGRPIHGDGNVWTPGKALRRVGDHLLDHLAQVEALVAAAPSIPDTWHGRAVTLESDWAHFTEVDLEEASSRLRRLAQLWQVRLAGLDETDLDADRGGSWTIRQIARHVADIVDYARQVGDLTQCGAASSEDAAFVFHEWDRRARAGDVEGLLSLYQDDAILESPLVPRILGQASGIVRGHAQLRTFFEAGTRGRPSDLVRWHRSGRYQFNGRTLIWEYPRRTPGGDQLDLVEVMDLTGRAIDHHRIYWGWVGSPLLTREHPA